MCRELLTCSEQPLLSH